jgi:hypothetical protein
VERGGPDSFCLVTVLCCAIHMSCIHGSIAAPTPHLNVFGASSMRHSRSVAVIAHQPAAQAVRSTKQRRPAFYAHTLIGTWNRAEMVC